MSKKTPEGLLRDWVRKTMNDPNSIEWVEPSRGSTVGLADCNLKFGNVSIPVELKAWKLVGQQVKGVMRPAQIRYHFMAYREGRRTAILYSVPIPSVDGFGVFLLPGKYVPMADRFVNQEASVYVGNNLMEEKISLSKILLSKSFWS